MNPFRPTGFAWLLGALLFAASSSQAAPPRSGAVDVGDGVKIHYVEDGARDAKTTIVFVPGFSASSAVWRGQMDAFAPKARVVAIDPRSQGDSTVTVRGNTPEQRAQDLRKVIDALGLRDVVLVGWSQGVQDLAAYAAAFEGEGVAGYALVDAPVGAGAAASVAQPQRLQQTLERMAFYSQYQERYLRGMFEAIIRSERGRRRIDEYVRIGMRTPPDLGMGMLMMDFIAYDRRPALAKFNRPTLVVASADSGELEEQREMAARIPGAKFETLAETGHAVFLDQPEKFTALLAAFAERAGRD